jgi:hypothetical protein
VRDIDRRRYDRLRANRELIDQAAALLRREARTYARSIPVWRSHAFELDRVLARTHTRVSPSR